VLPAQGCHLPQASDAPLLPVLGGRRRPAQALGLMILLLLMAILARVLVRTTTRRCGR
jgi:hypothetical protein